MKVTRVLVCCLINFMGICHTPRITDLFSKRMHPQICINIPYPDAVPPIHTVSSHVATDKGPSIDCGKFKFRKTDGRRIGIRFPVFILTYVYSSACLPNYNEISGGHIWRSLVRRRSSAGPVLPL